MQIPLKVSIWVRYLFQDKGVRGKKLLKLIQKYSHRSIYHHAAKAFDSMEGDKRKLNPRQPRKLTDQDERKILKLQDSVGSFTTKRLKVAVGINKRVCDETVRRTFKKFGYDYYHSSKKGLLKIKDVKARRKFAGWIKNFEREYLDRGCRFLFWWDQFSTQV